MTRSLFTCQWPIRRDLLSSSYSQPGYVFRDFCLKQGIFSWTINSLRVCSTNVAKSAIFVLNRVRVWGAGPHLPTQGYRELKMETFSGRRQLQPDVTPWFVQNCACSYSPYCRRVHRRKMSDWSSRDHVTLPNSKWRQYLHTLFIPVERRLIAA